MALKLDDIKEGTVYLRDKRNGALYYYEPALASKEYVKTEVRGKEAEKEELPDTYTGAKPYASHLTTKERAARFDELARMKPEQRKAAEVKAAKAGEELPYKPADTDESTQPIQAEVPADQTTPQTSEAQTSDTQESGKAPEQAGTSEPVRQPTRHMTDKANGVTYEDFAKKGWTDEQLIHNGYMVVE